MQGRVHFLTPILPVSDIRATLQYYKGVLGAGNDWEWGEPPTHAGCTIDTASFQFSLQPDLHERSRGIEFFMQVTEVDEIYFRVVAAGATILRDIENKPWNAREFCVQDCNGYGLRYAQFGFLDARRGKIDGVTVVRRHLTPQELADLMTAVNWTFSDNPEELQISVDEPICTAAAEYGGKCIGTGSILGHKTGNYLISNVIVHPDFQSQGVGKQIMQELDNWLNENGVPGAMVKLFTGLDRQPFYGQFGFRGPELGLVGMSKNLPKKP